MGDELKTHRWMRAFGLTDLSKLYVAASLRLIGVEKTKGLNINCYSFSSPDNATEQRSGKNGYGTRDSIIGQDRRNLQRWFKQPFKRSSVFRDQESADYEVIASETEAIGPVQIKQKCKMYRITSMPVLKMKGLGTSRYATILLREQQLTRHCLIKSLNYTHATHIMVKEDSKAGMLNILPAMMKSGHCARYL